MGYEKGFVYTLMDAGGPTDVREPYFQEAVDEMMRSRTLCAQANARLPSDPAAVADLEVLFGRP
ncbi:MAG: sugar O-acetyltransferase, partial [Treponemataceae bacterium]|nr:sugar O-acetyltransferase [Treponemataceae bacterium]